MQVRQIDFNVREYKTFINMFSDSTLQITFKKLPPVEFCCSIKEYSQVYKKVIKIVPLFPTKYLYQAEFY